MRTARLAGLWFGIQAVWTAILGVVLQDRAIAVTPDPVSTYAVIAAIGYVLALILRFAISRKREYLADAGSLELTKNPDALIRALRKIESHAAFDVPSRMEAFFIENPVASRVSGLFSTHPSVDARVAALQRYAGAA